jgi:hypothetical protein
VSAESRLAAEHAFDVAHLRYSSLAAEQISESQAYVRRHEATAVEGAN